MAPIQIPSTRLYSTSDRRSFLVSSLARAQGMVSSIYLLQRLNRLKISVMASATRRSSILASTLSTTALDIAFSSSSTGSVTPVLLTTPSKYLFDMEIVRLTRLPKVLASSEFILSTISSQVITPSFSKGISCRTK